MKTYIVFAYDEIEATCSSEQLVAVDKMDALMNSAEVSTWPNKSEVPEEYHEAIEWINEGDIVMHLHEVDMNE